MSLMDNKNIIAKRAAAYFQPGDIVNLGIGIPGLCSNYAAEGVMFHTENGLVGVGALAEGLQKVESFCNATAQEIIPVPGASPVDTSMSFGIIRGGRLDATVLGGLQVSESGDLANWATPGRAFGMGGAMDLCNGARKVIVAMELCTKDGKPKILKKCTFPLTGKACVDHIVTELCVIDVIPEGLKLVEIAPGRCPMEIQSMVEPKLIISDELKEMEA